MSSENDNVSIDRMSRKEFCKSLLMRTHLSVFAFISRFCSFLVREIAITCVSVIVMAMCWFMPSLWIILAATLPILGIMLLVHRYEIFKDAFMRLPLVRRMHDFGLSARVGLFAPIILFLLALLWIASYKSNEIDAVYERCGVSEVDKRYYANFGERDIKWADAELAVLEKVRAYHKNALYGLGAWYAVLLLACFVVPGNRKENRYGLPPKQ